MLTPMDSTPVAAVGAASPGDPADAPATASDPRAVRARAATAIMFATHAVLFASWTAQIPLVKARLGLTDGELGLALFGAPIGSVVAIVGTGWLLSRLGSRRMMQVCLLGGCAVAWTVGIAASSLQLFLALAVWGAFQGALDVSMNAQAVYVERRMGIPIMSSFHGIWSVGAFIGVGIGAVAVAAGVPLAAQLVVLGVLGLLVAEPPTRLLLPDPPAHREVDAGRGTASAWRNPVVLMLGLVVLASMLCEGAAADWSAVYLHDSLGAPAALAALGYAAFAAAMVVQRLSGDRVLARAAARSVLPVLAIVAAIGMTVTLVVGSPAIALVGFATLGIGVALVVPASFTVAGHLSGVPAGSAIAAVSAVGWVGFVAGPPLIGHIADAVTLPVALGLVPLLMAAIAVVVRTSRHFDHAPLAPSLELDEARLGAIPLEDL